jgi:magnesium chelatase accessory protein
MRRAAAERWPDLPQRLGPARLDWARDGADWPHRDRSRFVEAAGFRWHVQVFDPATPPLREPGRCILLLHGTGASSHSWRALAPRLAEQALVIVPDLPGHAFTAMPWPWQASLPGMAKAVADLLAVLGAQPTDVIGHSAGAAVALRMALDGGLDPREPARLTSLNGALLPMSGFAWQWFSPAAKLLASAPGVPGFLAWRAQDRQVLRRLLDSTGSRIDALGEALYARLVANPGHVAGALQMMARWDLDELRRDLPRLADPPHPWPLRLIVGDADRTVPPDISVRARRLLPHADLVHLPGLGHLAHEESPETVMAALAGAA